MQYDDKTKNGKLYVCHFLGCTPAGARTLDTLIKSQVLYQLSYGCIMFLLLSSALLLNCGCKGTEYF